MSMFGDAMPATQGAVLYPLPTVKSDKRDELDWERELVGLYLSDHPLNSVAEAIAESVTHLLGEIEPSMAGQMVTIAGMVASVRQITTKKGDPMAFVRIEDLQGGIEAIVFPAHLCKYPRALAQRYHRADFWEGRAAPRENTDHRR